MRSIIYNSNVIKLTKRINTSILHNSPHNKLIYQFNTTSSSLCTTKALFTKRSFVSSAKVLQCKDTKDIHSNKIGTNILLNGIDKLKLRKEILEFDNYIGDEKKTRYKIF